MFYIVWLYNSQFITFSVQFSVLKVEENVHVCLQNDICNILYYKIVIYYTIR